MSLPRAFVLAVAATLTLASGALPAAQLVEYYHAELDHFFLTGLAAEVAALDSGAHKGWTRTGMTIQTVEGTTGAGAGSFEVCRFLGNPARGQTSHLYTASAAECDVVKKNWPEDWVLETDSAFRVHAANQNTGACPAGTRAVYRLFNKRADINHRYTTDTGVFATMIAKGYTPEGYGDPKQPVVFCASNAAPAQPAAGAPVCTVTASTAFPVPGTPVTLTATCTDTPTSYAWINCAGSTGATCTANQTAGGPVTYGVIATNSRGSSAPANVTLNWQTAASAAPSCTVAASNPSPTVGTPMSLTANCSHAPTQFQWQLCSALIVEACQPLTQCASSATSCTVVSTQSGSVVYAVVASNSAGASTKATVNVDWKTGGTGTPPPPTTPTPFCTLTASSSSPAINSNLVLTASCTNNPTSYTWMNCTPASATANTCTTTQSTTGVKAYRVTAANANGFGTPGDVSVTWQSPPTAPPVCTLTPSTTTPYLGGTLTLTASCTQSPSSYNWTGCSSSGSTCQLTGTATGPATYSVTATNGFGTSSPASANVTWQATPPAGTDLCGQYTNVVRVNLPWGGHLDSHQNGGFPAGGVLVGRLTVPSSATGSSIPGTVSVVEYIDGQAQRTMTLSPSACDFRGFQPGVPPPMDASGVKNPMDWEFGINPNQLFKLSGMPGNNPALVPGQTYYINIRNLNYNTGTTSCTTTNCNVRITVNRPN